MNTRLTRWFVLFAAVLLLTPACAPEPALTAEPNAAAEWQPKSWNEPTPVALIDAEALTDALTDADAGELNAADDTRVTKTPVSGGAAARNGTDRGSIGLVGQRLRNDHLPIQANWVYLPGLDAFNQRMDELVEAAIQGTGKEHSPQVFDEEAGLSERGCVEGSSSWSAQRVLSDSRTGPKGGSGTALTCEVIDAFGSYLGVEVRTVVGTESETVSDERTAVYVDVHTGEIFEEKELWSAEAASTLWVHTVELLRRKAGGLSTAAIEPPSAEQVALAQGALATAQIIDGGALEVVLPAGIHSPELAGLVVKETTEPVQVRVEPQTALEWARFDNQLLLDAATLPFSEAPSWHASVHINCKLVACVAVTYDDGPSSLTPKLLETLREHESAATFFMLGAAALSMPDTVRQVAAEGHEIGSHTMRHPDLTGLTPEEVRAEVFDAADILAELTGRSVTSYRPPYGALNSEVLDEVDLPTILWSIDTNDWQKPGKKALISRSVDEARPGDIILFHDVHRDTVEVAGDVLKGLRDRGLTPVTVTQLFDGQLPQGRVLRR